MCEYCNCNLDGFSRGYAKKALAFGIVEAWILRIKDVGYYLEMEPDYEVLYAKDESQRYDFDESFIINFCPMCGRKLGKEE